MVLRMTRPAKRSGSSNFVFRKRIPRDVLTKAESKSVTVTLPEINGHAAHSVTVPLADTIKLSLRTRDPAVAKARSGAIEDQLQRLWAAIKAGPQRLTQKQIVALAGELYRAFAEILEDNPGPPSRWENVLAVNAAAKTGELASLMIFQTDEEKLLHSLETRFGKLTDAQLSHKGLVIDAASRKALLVEVAKAMDDAAKKLLKNAKGDFAPDPAAQRFPKWSDVQRANSGVTITSIFEGWKAEAVKRTLSQSTIEDYASRIKLFRQWLTHDDAMAVTPHDIVRYKEFRLSKVGAKTVKDSDLVTLKAVFGWAKDNLKLPENPAMGITVKAPKKVKEREPGFTTEEAIAILKAAKAYTRTNPQENPKTANAKRWLPWLCAYSGARVGEMAQLRKQDVFEIEGTWFLRITPEAGTVKNREERKVPIHEHLLDEGFIRFVEASSDNYLFLKIEKSSGALKALGTTKNRVRDFVRTIVKDSRVAPNHGWRHTFKTLAQEHQISDRLIDAICGHATRTVGDYYRTPTPKALSKVMEQFPRYL